jgi:phosphate-selective porin
MKNLLVALLTLTTSAALAQTAGTQPTSGNTPAAESAPAQSTSTPAEATPAATETPAAPSIDDRLTTAEGKVSALDEQNIETKGDLSALKKIKFSGYVQARYQAQQSLDENGTGGFNRFVIRRGRIKATYTGDVAQYMLQIDATTSGVALKDAEATLFIPGTKQNLSLTLGQTKWPFGYEGPQSSGEREFPERSLVIRSFLPGERDLGAKFNGKWGVFRLNAGIFNGNGTQNTNFIGTDNDKEKDVLGRVGFDLKWISGGVSGWRGLTLGKRTLPSADESSHYYRRTRLGADVQLYLDLLPVGGTAVKAEYITGTTYQRGGAEVFGVPASGFWVLLVQNLGLSDAVALRYDSFDYQNGHEAAEADSKLDPTNAVSTLGLQAMHYFGENLKVSATYELPVTATASGGTVKDPKDNLFTLQFQARF